MEKAEARAQAAVTFGSIVDSYLARYAAKRLKPGTLTDVERYLRRHWGALSSLPVRKITRADVAARLACIAEENGGFAANRARTALGSLYAWAIAEGLADANPVVGTRKAVDEIARDRVLTDEELRLIWRHAGEGDYGAIVRLLILTGQRREEVAAMTWAEVEGATWRINGDRTKNARAHEVTLSQPALEILGAQRRCDGRTLVFGSRGPFSGWSKAKASRGSGRGLHRHFKHPGYKVPTRANPAIKVDVKGDGGFCVLPPRPTLPLTSSPSHAALFHAYQTLGRAEWFVGREFEESIEGGPRPLRGKTSG